MQLPSARYVQCST